MQIYLFVCCILLFPALLLVRRVAANIYSSAVLKVLRQGRATRDELHPRLAEWLDRLKVYPVPLASSTGITRAAKTGAGWIYRRLAYTVMFLALLVFVSKVYVGEFLNIHPIFGFLNHVFIQLPCFDFIPSALRQAAGA